MRFPKVTTIGWICVAAFGLGCTRSATPPEAPTPLVRTGFSFVRADPVGRWLVACRPGPIDSPLASFQLEPYLFWPSGPGERLDDYVDSDPSGRYIVVIQKGRLVLIDSATGAREDLTAKGGDARDAVDTWSFSHRAASFDEKGRLLYWRRSVDEKNPPTLIMRSLNMNMPPNTDPGLAVETEISFGDSPGPGPFRAWLEGEWVVLKPLRDGKLGRDSESETTGSKPTARACKSFELGCVIPPRIKNAALVPIHGGPPIPFAEGITVMDNELVRRSPDGALEARTAQESEFHPRVPASCGGRLLASYHGKWLVACVNEGPERPPLRFYERTTAAPIDIALRISLRDIRDVPYDGNSLIPVTGFAQNTAALHLDMVTGQIHSLRGALVLGAESRRGLVITRERELYWFDLDKGREVMLARLERPRPEYERERYEPSFVEGRWAFVWPYLVDLERGEIAGTFAEKNIVMKLFPSGHLLVRRDRRGPAWKPDETLTDLFEWISPEFLRGCSSGCDAL